MCIKFKRIFIITILVLASCFRLNAQQNLPFRLPDTGETTSYTPTEGEDADFIISAPSLADNGDGTVTDFITGLMWQKTDGGEMTWENATTYCNNLVLGGASGWRLPTSLELFSINNYNYINPAMNSTFFTTTQAEYWWTSQVQADNPVKVWSVNAGGGIGAHPKTETISAGGTKRFHVRAVRTLISSSFPVARFTDNGDGTVSDLITGLVWQKIQPPQTMTWEEALAYAKTVLLAGKSDWRLPNIREIQSLNDVSLFKPSFNKTFFPNLLSGNFWSSTTMHQTASKAWDINIDYGIVSYNDKSLKENVLLVRGGFDNTSLGIEEAYLPGGVYEMGDHFGFVDPQHPSDEIPIHQVKVDSFYMSKTETTNQQFLSFLNASLLEGQIEVRDDIVYLNGGTDILCYTHQFESWYSISYDGTVFSMGDFRANHPMVGVMWFGAATFCNWMSLQNGLQECYNLVTWDCDFTKNGYRLPTEAEWEFAGRGGHINPYYNYPNGNAVVVSMANLPASGDPYETGPYPNTTPVGFYDGTNRQKAQYNWPGTATSYQTTDGANGYGLYDMQGNVWELLNDWYGQNYYSVSPFDNPKGPESGFIMPDGKPYRGMRGGNWYNGYLTAGVNDGHSRVSNRNPSYYRGPLDPNHPWYHIGFRMVRKYSVLTGLNETGSTEQGSFRLLQNYPNPFNSITSIRYYIPEPTYVTLKITNILGNEVAMLVSNETAPGWHTVTWSGSHDGCSVFFCTLITASCQSTIKIIHIK
jgi:formylglycine-generating enzyme required for sulfatase activity